MEDRDPISALPDYTQQQRERRSRKQEIFFVTIAMALLWAFTMGQVFTIC
jgi:hypothetical protein